MNHRFRWQPVTLCLLAVWSFTVGSPMITRAADASPSSAIDQVPSRTLIRPQLSPPSRRRYTLKEIPDYAIQGPRGETRELEVEELQRFLRLKNNALAMQQKADFQGALEQLTGALAIHDGDGESWAALGLSCRKLKRYSESAYAYQQALLCDPSNELYLISLAQILLTFDMLRDVRLTGVWET